MDNFLAVLCRHKTAMNMKNIKTDRDSTVRVRMQAVSALEVQMNWTRVEIFQTRTTICDTIQKQCPKPCFVHSY